MINCISQKTSREESRKVKYKTQLQERKSSENNWDEMAEMWADGKEPTKVWKLVHVCAASHFSPLEDEVLNFAGLCESSALDVNLKLGHNVIRSGIFDLAWDLNFRNASSCSDLQFSLGSICSYDFICFYFEGTC